MPSLKFTRPQIHDLMIYVGFDVANCVLDSWTIDDLIDVERWCFQKCHPSTPGRRAHVPVVILKLLDVNPAAVRLPQRLPTPRLGPAREFVVWSLRGAKTE